MTIQEMKGIFEKLNTCQGNKRGTVHERKNKMT